MLDPRTPEGIYNRKLLATGDPEQAKAAMTEADVQAAFEGIKARGM